MSKIVYFKNLEKLIKHLGNCNIVLVGGCFDLLHLGHIKFLQAAKKEGEILIIALESDKNIKKTKGSNRPVNKQLKRAQNLAEVKEADYIILLPELKTNQDYEDLIGMIKPKVIAVTENDKRLENKKKQAGFVGAKVVPVIPYLKEYSTTKILNKISV